MFPHTITVWNQIASNHTGGFTYHRTIIKSVRYESIIAKQSTKEGESNASTLLLFVFPTEMVSDSVYIDPESFKDLKEYKGVFTFDTDTYIGLGEIDTDLPSGEHYSIDSVTKVNAMGNDIHHFEIKGS